MPPTYHRNLRVKFINFISKTLIGLGLAPKGMHLLTVRGRKTGQLYTTPVTLIEADDQRWLVSPYGEVKWVQNARAAGEVQLARGSHIETVKLYEVGAPESAPILKKYIAVEPITRPYFTARPDSPLEAFAAEAARHPVFRLDP